MYHLDKMNMIIRLKDGIILNGNEDMLPQENLMILIEGEKIVDIVDNQMQVEDYEIIDLRTVYNAKLVPFVIKYKITRKYLQVGG